MWGAKEALGVFWGGCRIVGWANRPRGPFYIKKVRIFIRTIVFLGSLRIGSWFALGSFVACCPGLALAPARSRGLSGGAVALGLGCSRQARSTATCEHDLRISQLFFGALLLGAGSAVLGRPQPAPSKGRCGGFDPDAVMVGTIPGGCEVLVRARHNHSSM